MNQPTTPVQPIPQPIPRPAPQWQINPWLVSLGTALVLFLFLAAVLIFFNPANLLRVGLMSSPTATAMAVATPLAPGAPMAGVVSTATASPTSARTGTALPTATPVVIVVTATPVPPTPTPTATATPVVRKRIGYSEGVCVNGAGWWPQVSGVTRITVIDLATSVQNEVYASGGCIRSAAISPDGKKILISLYTTPLGSENQSYLVSVLRIVGIDGGNPVDIGKSDPHGAERETGFLQALWSPDARKVVYRGGDPNNIGDRIMNSDGTGSRELSSSGPYDYQLFFSVDGKWIVTGSGDALEIDGNRRVPLEQLGKIQVYDQRYWPWRITDSPVCKGASFWECE
jgi:hypothetical protein